MMAAEYMEACFVTCGLCTESVHQATHICSVFTANSRLGVCLNICNSCVKSLAAGIKDE